MMLPNTNQAAMKKLISKSLKNNAGRNRYVVLAIILTTWLITSVFSIGMSFVKSFDVQEQKMLGTAAQAQLSDPTADQLALLGSSDKIRDIGISKDVAEWIPAAGSPSDSRQAVFGWYDRTEWNAMKAPLLGGRAGGYPEERSEVVVPAWMLDELGIAEPKAGMELSLTYRAQAGKGGLAAPRAEKFRLKGWYDDYPHLAGKPGTVIVSEAFAREAAGAAAFEGEVPSTASMTFKDESGVQAALAELEPQLRLGPDQQLHPVASSSDSGTAWSTYAGIAGIVLLVMVSGHLLIYNVLYVSVSMDTKQYGLLKTIGATQRQIKTLVRGQSNRLALIGIPIGLAAGALTSFAAVPLALGSLSLETGVEISFHPLIFIGAALFAWLTAWFASRKPARIAGKVSPVEAAKYAGPARKRGKGGARLHRMALRNLFRDRKRAATVFLSLFLGMTTFLTVNLLVLSMNTDNFIKTYVKNDFELENKTLGFEYQGEPKPKLSKELVQQIKGMKGVTDVRASYSERAYMPYSPEVFGRYMDELARRNGFERPSDEELSTSKEGFAGFAVGLDSRTVEELSKKAGTPIDMERFEAGEIALSGSPELPLGGKFKLGEPGGGPEKEFELGGVMPPDGQVPFSGYAPNIYISKKAMEQWLGREPIGYKLAVQAAAKQHPQLQQQLEALIAGDGELKLSSKLDWAKQLNSSKRMFYILGGAVTLILASIGILNFASTMMTSIIVRRQEFAVMESIGMTRRQLRRLLLLEGTGYAGISLLLISTLGTLISYGAFKLFSQEADYAVFAFPAVPLAIAYGLILGACWLVPLLAFRRSGKLSIVERLRDPASR
ncbi:MULTISPECIES: FtsX-like permease family protein [unclassified Paenibacillus]|uniref:ABC transporter permease n=1 Tax=unclassified Paenibacillus TaxID=185978 RepID=UPI000955371C|nr:MULTISPECIES: FtsX-like permease family protein [unclassified Paenibacillus]ASS68341.1 FtsX-like permease family protein [Paenibacillus sp. RUD330]SIR29646.1 putative ABC transport system permease protein [Paenibacillus sp. RU4X]SIR41673.1 putative ABC transport system permease protein [Paenibacillus sp. RU4T]